MASKESLCRLYKELIRVCEQWPIDTSRTGRDFGEYLRNNYRTKYRQEDFNVCKHIFLHFYFIIFNVINILITNY